MTDAQYRVAHVSEIVTPPREPGTAPWRAVRRHFDIGSFGIAAYTAEAAGEVFTGDHTELDTRHEELFYVAAGRAAIRVAGETVDAPAGTFVHVPDPAALRGATALEPGTILLAVGGEPGKAFEVSLWERRYEDKLLDDLERSSGTGFRVCAALSLVLQEVGWDSRGRAAVPEPVVAQRRSGQGCLADPPRGPGVRAAERRASLAHVAAGQPAS